MAIVLNKAGVVTDSDRLANGYFNGISGITTVESAENFTEDNVMYIHLTDGKAYVSDTGTADDVRADGIALNTGSTGEDVNLQTSGVYTTSGLTDKGDYYLGASGALSLTVGAVRIGTALSTTKLFIKINDGRDGRVGEMRPWAKSISGMITQLPAYWIEADGSTISDAESPINGEPIPNMQTNNPFLRGDTASDATATLQGHDHTGLTEGTADIGSAGTRDQKHGIINDTFDYYVDTVWIIKKK